MQITIERFNNEKRLEPITINAHPCGEHLAVHKTASGRHWTVTHKASGYAITDRRHFDSKAQAMRYGSTLQAHLDFSKLAPDADMAWDVVKAFGSENIRRAMSAAFQEAFGC